MAQGSTRNCCAKGTAFRPSSSRRRVTDRSRDVSSREGRKPVCSSRSATRLCLTKPFNDDVLLSTIQQCIEHSRAVLREQAQMSVLRARYKSLTPREREVMALVVTGLLNKQVGAELGIS